MGFVLVFDRERDLQAVDDLGFFEREFWEDRLIGDTEVVVAAAVEFDTDAVEVTDAWECDVDQAVEEFVHASAAECHVVEAFADIKRACDPYGFLNPGVKQDIELKYLVDHMDNTYPAPHLADKIL